MAGLNRAKAQDPSAAWLVAQAAAAVPVPVPASPVRAAGGDAVRVGLQHAHRAPVGAAL